MRKLLVPAMAALLLAGCVTGYGYRGYGGHGDYYYGQPSVEYRYYGGYGGYYGYPGYPYYGGYGYWGSPYRYGYSPYYGYPRYPYYSYPYRYPHRHYDNRPGRPYQGQPPRQGGNGPWTGVDDLRRRINQSAPPPGSAPRNQSQPNWTRPQQQAIGQPRPTGDSRPSGEPRHNSTPRPAPRASNRHHVQEQER